MKQRWLVVQLDRVDQALIGTIKDNKDAADTGGDLIRQAINHSLHYGLPQAVWDEVARLRKEH